MQHEHRLSLFRLVALLSPVLLLLGQTPASATEARSPGSWSLQFRVTDNFTLSSFDGSMIALKRHFSGTTAVRLGVGLWRSSLDEGSSSDGPTGQHMETDRDGDSTLMDLNLLLLRHRTPEERVTFLWGVGPRVQYRQSDEVRVTVFPDTTTSRLEDEATRWTAGLRGVAGVECSVVDWLALHAEYALDAYRLWEDNEATQTDPVGAVSTTEQDRKVWNLASSGVLFGASVYF